MWIPVNRIYTSWQSVTDQRAVSQHHIVRPSHSGSPEWVWPVVIPWTRVPLRRCRIPTKLIFLSLTVLWPRRSGVESENLVLYWIWNIWNSEGGCESVECLTGWHSWLWKNKWEQFKTNSLWLIHVCLHSRGRVYGGVVSALGSMVIIILLVNNKKWGERGRKEILRKEDAFWVWWKVVYNLLRYTHRSRPIYWFKVSKFCMYMKLLVRRLPSYRWWGVHVLLQIPSL